MSGWNDTLFAPDREEERWEEEEELVETKVDGSDVGEVLLLGDVESALLCSKLLRFLWSLGVVQSEVRTTSFLSSPLGL